MIYVNVSNGFAVSFETYDVEVMGIVLSLLLPIFKLEYEDEEASRDSPIGRKGTKRF